MRKALIIFGKSLLALLSLAGVALLWFTGWVIWHYEYGIGLPTESTLSALSPDRSRLRGRQSRRLRSARRYSAAGTQRGRCV